MCSFSESPFEVELGESVGNRSSSHSYLINAEQRRSRTGGSGGKKQTTFPQSLQWCLRTVREKGALQIEQSLTEESSTHFTIACSSSFIEADADSDDSDDNEDEDDKRPEVLRTRDTKSDIDGGSAFIRSEAFFKARSDAGCGKCKFTSFYIQIGIT